MWKTYNIRNSCFSLWISEFLLIQIWRENLFLSAGYQKTRFKICIFEKYLVMRNEIPHLFYLFEKVEFFIIFEIIEKRRLLLEPMFNLFFVFHSCLNPQFFEFLNEIWRQYFLYYSCYVCTPLKIPTSYTTS